MTTADKLREIAGQDTEPPLWIYVTKDQVPTLTCAADALDKADERVFNGFIDGFICCAKMFQDETRAFRKIWDRYAALNPSRAGDD